MKGGKKKILKLLKSQKIWSNTVFYSSLFHSEINTASNRLDIIIIIFYFISQSFFYDLF